MEIENNTVILGYHSPTEWVFTPEAIALYNSVIINKEVVEKVINEGHNSKSKYRVIKADIITALIEKGILIPKEYPKGIIERERISSIIDFFFSEHENDMIDLLSYAYDTFIKHEEATLKSFVETNDPYWEDVTKQLLRLKNIRKSLDLKVSIKDKEVQKSILRMYFEDSILTPEIFKNGYNPIFQWEGYARFEQYLMKYRRGDNKEKIHSIQKGSEYHVLSSISNIILPCRTIRSSDEIKILLKKWEEFSNIRKEISVTNKKIWDMISGMKETYENDNIYNDFVNEFEYILDNYLNSTNFQIMEINKSIEKVKTRNYSRITKYIIATIGSVINSEVPFTGGIKPVLEDVYSALIENNIKKSYLPFKAIFEYEHIISNVLLNRKYIKNKTVLGTEYSSIKYWDKVTS